MYLPNFANICQLFSNVHLVTGVGPIVTFGISDWILLDSGANRSGSQSQHSALCTPRAYWLGT